jgi:hypothetical protein
MGQLRSARDCPCIVHTPLLWYVQPSAQRLCRTQALRGDAIDHLCVHLHECASSPAVLWCTGGFIFASFKTTLSVFLLIIRIMKRFAHARFMP